MHAQSHSGMLFVHYSSLQLTIVSPKSEMSMSEVI